MHHTAHKSEVIPILEINKKSRSKNNQQVGQNNQIKSVRFDPKSAPNHQKNQPRSWKKSRYGPPVDQGSIQVECKGSGTIRVGTPPRGGSSEPWEWSKKG